MGLDAKQLRLLVIRPVLAHLGLWSIAAERLLLATALHESGGLVFLRQVPDGPALGLYQMEPGTNADIWTHYLAFRPALAAKVWGFAGGWLARERELVGNLNYATAMARIHYLRVPAALPDAESLLALADYWKRHYNTARGKGTTVDFVARNLPHWLTPAFRDEAWPGT